MGKFRTAQAPDSKHAEVIGFARAAQVQSAPVAPAPEPERTAPTYVGLALPPEQYAALRAIAEREGRPLRHVAGRMLAELLAGAAVVQLTPKQRTALERRAADDERTPEQMLQRLVRPVLAELEE